MDIHINGSPAELADALCRLQSNGAVVPATQRRVAELPTIPAFVWGRLYSADVTFHTNDEDKDHDTQVTVRVFDKYGQTVVFGEGTWGKFNDQEDTGPFDLLVDGLKSRSDILGGRYSIRIDPNGNDTWRFNFTITLRFVGNPSDPSSVLPLPQQGIELSEDHRTRNFTIPLT